jgi:hypothetical protein
MKAVLVTGTDRLAPFDDPQGLAEAVGEPAEQPEQPVIARPEVRQIASRPTWRAVASGTGAVLREATPSPSLRSRCNVALAIDASGAGAALGSRLVALSHTRWYLSNPLLREGDRR